MKGIIMTSPKLIMLSLTVASTLVAAAPATAGWTSKNVRYADLDLSTDAGRDHLQMRIKQAVKQVCGAPRAFTLSERADQRLCEKDSLLRAAPEGERIITAYMEKRRLALGGASDVGTN